MAPQSPPLVRRRIRLFGRGGRLSCYSSSAALVTDSPVSVTSSLTTNPARTTDLLKHCGGIDLTLGSSYSGEINNKKKNDNDDDMKNKRSPKTTIMTHEDSEELASNNNTPKVELIEPGMVLIRNLVNDEECQRLAATAYRMGEEGEDGFYTATTTTTTAGSRKQERILNTGEKGRGRIYDAATRFPSHVTDHCVDAVQLAKATDPISMPDMVCTHVLLNMYTNRDGLVWHRDIYENDGKSDHPVVNLCVGASCRFGFTHNDDDVEKGTYREVILRNGDCILFGGPCRLIKHAVLEVLLEDCPKWMLLEEDSGRKPCRLSFTFRDSPEVLGREAEFKYFRCDEHLVGQDEFEVPPVDKRESWVALPSQQSQKKLALVSDD